MPFKNPQFWLSCFLGALGALMPFSVVSTYQLPGLAFATGLMLTLRILTRKTSYLAPVFVGYGIGLLGVFVTSLYLILTR